MLSDNGGVDFVVQTAANCYWCEQCKCHEKGRINICYMSETMFVKSLDNAATSQFSFHSAVLWEYW